MCLKGEDDTKLSGSYLQSFVSMENKFETSGVANKKVNAVKVTVPGGGGSKGGERVGIGCGKLILIEVMAMVLEVAADAVDAKALA